MNTILIILACVFFPQMSTPMLGDDRPITFEQLPVQSQQLIKSHFSELSIALVKMDSDFLEKSYEVIFTNGNKIEFDGRGNWKEIDCKWTQCPDKLIPVQIKNYVKQYYPNNRICQITKETWNGYEVDLSNGLSLEFNSSFKLIEIDD